MRQYIGTASSCVRLLRHNIVRLARHSVRAQLAALRQDARVARLPRPQALLGIVQREPCGLGVGVRGALLAGYDGRVVEQVDQLACLGCEQDLLLGALDDGRGVDVVGFLELLARDVGELGFGDEGLGFGADELLLEGDELGGFGLFVLELLDLVLDLWAMILACGLVGLKGQQSSYLLLVRTAWLHRALRVANLLQHAAAVLKALGEQVLLLRDLGQQHTQLIADIAQGLVVGALTPLAQLAGNGRTFLGRLLVRVDRMVLGLDELVEFLREFGLLGAAQRGQGEVRFARGAAGVVAAL